MASMSLNAAAGLPGMLKAGHTHQGGGGAGSGGAESVLLRNVEAARDLTRIVSTSLGPDGRNKLVVNHLGRIIVTSDCAAIVRELEIEHPAARMIAMASDAQDKECGDGTTVLLLEDGASCRYEGCVATAGSSSDNENDNNAAQMAAPAVILITLLIVFVEALLQFC